MSTEARWQRLQDLFHAACALPPEEREAFASTHAGNDSLLLDELLVMLRIEGSATWKVREPMKSAQVLVDAAQTLPAGTRFGPWAVDKPIGRGGMGQVYLAHRADGAYERDVALKLISQSMFDARQCAYFDVERQWLAQMHHPAIAQIHDAGTDELGRPWLVMEYIEGQPITRFCEEHALSLRQRIELFLRVCDGIQHAHQKGVVHRDIKPGNVLVSQIDGVPSPYLIDFGIATGTGDTTSQPAGTPGYMSPEQADPTQQGDSRSDIYSLGALLYEIVSGARPPASGTENDSCLPSEHIRTLAPDDIRTLAQRRGLDPGRLIRTLREDLDWVVTRAMQPEPAARYQSVSLLADDLRRFLDGYPVMAAPARRSVAIRKFVARHRLGVSAVALVLLALVGGLAATVWALQKAELEARRARTAADFLGSVLSGVDPDTARDLDKTLMLRVLDDAAARISTELASDPDNRYEIELTIADTYASLEHETKGIAHLEALRELAIAHWGKASMQYLLILQRLGKQLGHFDRLDESEALLNEGIALIDRHPGLRETLPHLQADLRSALSWTLRQKGRTGDAMVHAQAAYDELSTTQAEDHSQRIDAGTRLAILLSDTGRYDEAIALQKELIALRGRQTDMDHPQMLDMRVSLSVFHLQKRDYAGAEAVLQAMLDPVARQLGPESSTMMRVRANLAGALRQQGKIEEAGPHYRFAYERALAEHGPDSTIAIMTRANLANWLRDSGQLETAHAQQTASLAQAVDSLGPEHDMVAEILRGLGLTQIALGHLPEARASLERSRAILTARYGDAAGPLARIRESIAALEAAEAGTRSSGE
ncbi:serine/threonine-protein kinase [Xanthomonadaceae bacterium JHOS43]|nr:serine/threonine-protein kinase [Xanthomonadaceae bacterium JHOS43]